ncbi:hypothetical protein OOU_Y34scaffold00633g11 [Pyricularia oryzae Y34]|uniref:Uncharacterized protein n=1 Tax=Pyricularia oryzae (strain Y34) TaxID=1143189 RepID=A0AA97NV79_PYRO3|nr:hypothetical protein OOU_Y34scaffold00633g11 [Pyricularia oryzae Y34]
MWEFWASMFDGGFINGKQLARGRGNESSISARHKL